MVAGRPARVAGSDALRSPQPPAAGAPQKVKTIQVLSPFVQCCADQQASRHIANILIRPPLIRRRWRAMDPESSSVKAAVAKLPPHLQRRAASMLASPSRTSAAAAASAAVAAAAAARGAAGAGQSSAPPTGSAPASTDRTEPTATPRGPEPAPAPAMDPMDAEPTSPVESMVWALSTTDGPGATASSSQAASRAAAAAQASLSGFFRSRAATLPAPLLVHAAQRSRIIRLMSESGLGVEDEDGTPVVVTLQQELKDQGTREFQMKHFDTAAEVYNEALLLGALQRLCFAMTSHYRLGEHWAGSGARLPHAAGSVAGDVHLLVVSHLPPACGELAVILHSNRAECMLRLNRWADAIYESGAALSLDPAHAKSHSRHTRGFEGLVPAPVNISVKRLKFRLSGSVENRKIGFETRRCSNFWPVSTFK